MAAVCFAVITGAIVKMLSGDLTLLTMLFFGFYFPTDFVFCCLACQGTRYAANYPAAHNDGAGNVWHGWNNLLVSYLFAIFPLDRRLPFSNPLCCLLRWPRRLLSEKVGDISNSSCDCRADGNCFVNRPVFPKPLPRYFIRAMCSDCRSWPVHNFAKAWQRVISLSLSPLSIIAVDLLYLTAFAPLPSHFMMPAPDELFC